MQEQSEKNTVDIGVGEDVERTQIGLFESKRRSRAGKTGTHFSEPSSSAALPFHHLPVSSVAPPSSSRPMLARSQYRRSLHPPVLQSDARMTEP